MIGVRRFITILVALVLAAGVEVASQAMGQGGWSANGQFAILGIVAVYFGGDAYKKRAQAKYAAGA